MSEDFLPLKGIDYVEFYVGNAKQAAHYYKTAFGFQSFAYAGLETGVRDRASYVLRQGTIKLVLTAPLTPDSDIAEHIKKHGDGVKVIAFAVDDAESSYNKTIAKGARGSNCRTAQDRIQRSACCQCACSFFCRYVVS